MARTIKITTENQISVAELTDWSLHVRAGENGADYIEVVKTQRMYELFGDAVVMMVDESGHCNHKPINPVASFLYGADIHGGVIAGDILFGVQKGADILPPNHVEELQQTLVQKFPMLQKVV